MTRRTWLAAALAGGILTLGVTEPADAGERRYAKPGPSKSASAKKDKVRKLYGIPWHSTLSGAFDASSSVGARKRRKPARPVFYLRMLGDLAGLT